MLHKDRIPEVSIVIPCYNHGKFIDETLKSIEQIKDSSIYEVIIVNDGSTDSYTNERLKEISESGLYNVIFQKNQGVCVARNIGMSNTRGKYILPVDSDNMLTPEYIEEALNIFNNNPEISIVYADYFLFGDQKGIRKAGKFNLQRLMLGNFIENCSMMKKELINAIGGYDPFPTIVGHEDWELFLRAAFNGYKFFYLEKPLFYYRVLPNSQIKRLNANKIKGNTNADYFIKKHVSFYGPQYIDEYFLSKFRSNFFGFLYKIILMLYFPEKFSGLVNKGKLRKYL